MDVSAEEIRVLGCLIEKQMTTPDYYPMTQNALQNACNQSTSREPVVSFTDGTIITAINSLRDRGWVRALHSPGQRAVKYRHVIDEMLGVEPAQAAVLAVLLLRGDQTAGELRTRTARYHDFSGVAEVGDVLAAMAAGDERLVQQLPRRPGEKESRWRHLLGGSAELDGTAPPSDEPRGSLYPSWDGSSTGGGDADRVAALEVEIAALRLELAALASRLDRLEGA